MAKSKPKSAYAVFDPKTGSKNIYGSWNECERVVKGTQLRYKGFYSEAEAKEWLDSGASYETASVSEEKTATNLRKEYGALDRNAIFCDAGQSKGKSAEVNVTDIGGNPLLREFSRESSYFGELNVAGFLELDSSKSNNYGELVGLYLALIIANERGVNKVYTDSELVRNYWSKNHYKGNDPKTYELIQNTSELRTMFERAGGTVEHVSGDLNPADLGRHKSIWNKIRKNSEGIKEIDLGPIF